MAESFKYRVGVGDARTARVSVIMGSQSDWPTMVGACKVLEEIGILYKCRITSAHRTPDRLRDYAMSARGRGIQVIIAGAGGAAHLPGMAAAWTTVPVLGVPVESHALKGMDSLLSIVQMPRGVPVGTLAIGESGAVNAAILAASIISICDPEVILRLDSYRERQRCAVAHEPIYFQPQTT